MRKLTLIVALAAMAAQVRGTDLNPVGGNTCGAGTITGDPSEVTGESGFLKIYQNLTNKLGDGEMWQINTDDGTWWHSTHWEEPENYSYMIIKFVKPEGYETGTLYWQVRVDGPDVYAYRWNKEPTPHQWTYMNKNDGGSAPPTKTYTIPASYFDANGVLWLLFKGNGTPAYIDADVVDIHW